MFISECFISFSLTHRWNEKIDPSSEFNWQQQAHLIAPNFYGIIC